MPELSPDSLRHYVDPKELDFDSTEEITPLIGTVGQERAVHAIDFGLRVKTKGFNIYVAGPLGTGKHSAVDAFVQDIAKEKKVPTDWCYVYNFMEPDKPSAVELPPGAGVMLARDMDELIEAWKTEIPRAFESEEYENRKNQIINGFQAERDNLISELRHKAENIGFSLEITAAGIFTVPLIDGKPLKHETFDSLPEGQRAQIKTKTEELQGDINHLLTQIRAMEKGAKDKLSELDREIALFAVGHFLEILMEKYKELPKVTNYLSSVQQDIVDNLEAFKSGGKKAEMIIPGIEAGAGEPNFDKYKVNVFINNASGTGAPVVTETNPTYYNLFGRLEYKAQLSAMTTDFTMLKPGAIHKANGGYLIINALDLLVNFLSWDALKRTLDNEEARIENIGEQFRLVPAATLQPEPIPLDVKVVLIGSPYIYQLLYSLDENFRKLFKVKADFNWEMERSANHIDKYAAFVAARCAQDHGIKHFDRTGLAKVIEFGSRLADDQRKLSTRFIEIDNLISEASFWAEQNGSKYVGGEHVRKAIDEKIFRSNLVEVKIQEMIEDGTIMVDAEGSMIGQLNGLSVYEMGDYSFGRPTRITCETFIGRGGIVNIEREVKLGGPIHNKGMMILTGYLGGKYAQDLPMVMSATVCFEQLYGEIEGDSASSTELYAILSSLSELPLKQNFAVTGSVNQKGEIQPIGGVNQKIEGFFDVCKAAGLSGDHGVMIPHQNANNLMLKEEIVEAVRQGKFHIWAIKTVDEGIEILTGSPAGARGADGSYPENSVNWLVNKRLAEFGQKYKEFSAPKNEEEEERARPAA